MFSLISSAIAVYKNMGIQTSPILIFSNLILNIRILNNEKNAAKKTVFFHVYFIRFVFFQPSN